MIPLRLLYVATALAAAASTACDSDPGPDTGALTSAEFASRFCSLYAQCCAGGGYATEGPTCRSIWSSVRVVDAAAAEQCLKDHEALAQAGTHCELKDGIPKLDSCEKAFSSGETQPDGTRKPGESCEFGDDDDKACAGDATCDADEPPSFAGTCLAFVVVGEGAQCVGVRDEGWSTYSKHPADHHAALCDSSVDLFCSLSGSCKKKAQPGGSCEADYGCFAGAFCKGSQCTPKLTLNSPCSTGGDPCAETTYCSPGTQVCVPGLAPGTSCTVDVECATGSCSQGTCRRVGFAGMTLSLLCE